MNVFRKVSVAAALAVACVLGAGATAVRADEPRYDLSGEWIVEDGDMLYKATIVQAGHKIAGTYDYMQGTFKGHIEGDTLILTWDQPGNTRGGYARLDLSRRGRVARGTYTYDPSRYNSGLNGSASWVFVRKN